MISWLYRYIFRGWSIILLGAVITSLWLAWQAVHPRTQHSPERAVTAPRTTPPTRARGASR
jgi:hypothetical protein